MLETSTLETLYSSQIYIINSVDNTKLSTVSVKHAPPPPKKKYLGLIPKWTAHFILIHPLLKKIKILQVVTQTQ